MLPPMLAYARGRVEKSIIVRSMALIPDTRFRVGGRNLNNNNMNHPG